MLQSDRLEHHAGGMLQDADGQTALHKALSQVISLRETSSASFIIALVNTCLVSIKQSHLPLLLTGTCSGGATASRCLPCRYASDRQVGQEARADIRNQVGCVQYSLCGKVSH